MLVIYGKRVLTLPPTSDPYPQKYKGIWICLSILTRALSGNYVNFGVFDLYGDPALKVRCLSCLCSTLFIDGLLGESAYWCCVRCS